MTTFCRKCGAHNEPDARFCESCGSPMPVSMQPAADVAPEAPTVGHRDRTQQPRRSWVLYAVGALAILGIGIVAAVFFAPNGPLAGLVSTERAKAPGAKESTAQGNSLFSGLPALFGARAGGGVGDTSSGSAGTPSERSARAIFESRHSESIQAGLMKIESFQKVNGRKLNIDGGESYVLEYVVTVVYPKGVMPECVEVSKQGTYNPLCFVAQLRGASFKPVGHREKMPGDVTFENTERGWRGEDGKLY